jgi:hypothetical protein
MTNLEEQLKRRLRFEAANKLIPLHLQQWIAENQHKQGWELELWNQFIFPLQCEIATLRYRPEKAIPVEQPNSADDIAF